MDISIVLKKVKIKKPKISSMRDKLIALSIFYLISMISIYFIGEFSKNYQKELFKKKRIPNELKTEFYKVSTLLALALRGFCKTNI